MEGAKDPQYPIGKAEAQSYAQRHFDEELKNELLVEISILPSTVEMALLNLDEPQLEMPYRPGSWTINQLVHHLADSHINAYLRCKLALTEENPTIAPYQQDAWARLADNDLPVNVSTTLLHALHRRWHALLKSLDEDDWQKTFYHPELHSSVSLWEMLKQYAWHSKHHVAQILLFREQNNW